MTDASRAEEVASDDRARVLVVDDEPAARRLLTRILEKRGYVASAASDVASAIEMLEKEEPALVMTDLDMPGGSGLELIEVLRSRPNVATILVTGRGSTEIASAALMSGAYGYLTKPFLPDEIEITVFNALRRRELEIESRRYQERLEETVRARTSDLAESLAQLQKAQDELQDLNEQLRELGRMKAQFIQVVSHELRTPLTVIRGGVQTVLRGGDRVDGELREQLLRSVENNADGLSRMINKILAVNAIGQGSIEARSEHFRLDEIAHAALGTFDEAAKRRVSLRVSPSPALGHRDLISEVVRDVLENALIHTEGPVTLSTWQVGDEATLAVSDDGPGMDPGLVEKLLAEPFVQGDSSTTRSVGGLGLSLFLAGRVIDASGGRLEVETSPESGSTFSIRLPAGDD